MLYVGGTGRTKVDLEVRVYECTAFSRIRLNSGKQTRRKTRGRLCIFVCMSGRWELLGAPRSTAPGVCSLGGCMMMYRWS